MVPDAAVVGPGDRPQLDPTVVGFERLHELGAVRQQAVLEVDGGERCRELAQVAGWCTDQTAHLAEGPVRGRNWFVAARRRQHQSAGVVAARLHAHVLGLDGAGCRAVGSGADGAIQRVKGEIALVIRPRKPLGRTRPIRSPRVTSTLNAPDTGGCV